MVGELSAAGGLNVDVLVEPKPRNTAAAVAALAVHVAAIDSAEAVLVIAPSDHSVADPQAWVLAVLRAVETAQRDNALVLLGATPDRPTGAYGYLVPEHRSGDLSGIARFEEKPTPARASALMEEGALWNCGLVVGQAGKLIDSLGRHAPDILKAVQAAYAAATRTTEGLCLGHAFARAPAEPFDTAVLEKEPDLFVSTADCGWRDLGDWDSVFRAGGTEGDNLVHGQAFVMDSHGCLIHAEDAAVAALGLEDLVVVAAGGHVMIAPRERAQEVRKLASEAERHWRR
jgi:mannose-1-phosphate guanylyltransferase